VKGAPPPYDPHEGRRKLLQAVKQRVRQQWGNLIKHAFGPQAPAPLSESATAAKALALTEAKALAKMTPEARHQHELKKAYDLIAEAQKAKAAARIETEEEEEDARSRISSVGGDDSDDPLSHYVDGEAEQGRKRRGGGAGATPAGSEDEGSASRRGKVAEALNEERFEMLPNGKRVSSEEFNAIRRAQEQAKRQASDAALKLVRVHTAVAEMRTEAAGVHDSLIGERDDAINLESNDPFLMAQLVVHNTIAFLNKIGNTFNEHGEIASSSSSSL